MKVPRTMRIYCPKCMRHTEHLVSLYKRGRDRTLAEGNRRYERKKRGYGGQPKPIPRRAAKTTRKQTLKLRCTVCNYTSHRRGIRLRKLEIA